ncbi:hypothetical protein Asulf_01160 [Archaeoglobus sulfaticallidus PM70-1]|uniref:Uncharacterized protein n=1 Tax=Archaeoglobus sulfaticallidus PM70-1 TaxID=387631 RepID=N0BC10_9EURY|nr:hypothetical protein [Archaeoglobus sulfaticallidus]AGK61159.1 hypothetical protein Asulf_01160 [Archaeoglobus sulfaticallidus PM70-1]
MTEMFENSKLSTQNIKSLQNTSDSLIDLELEYSREELEAYTQNRLKGISKKTRWWIEKASQTFWEQTQGVISYNTINRLREYTLNNWESRDAWSKVLSFAKGFLGYLSKLRMDQRYLNFSIFLEMPKAIKEKKRTTDRVITEKDVERVIKFFIKRWKAGELSRKKTLSHVTQTLFGAYSGQRPYTIARLRVDQFEEALKLKTPTILVEASQDKIRMEHYVPLHPDIVPFLKALLKIRKKQGKEKMFDYNSYEQLLKRAKISLERGDLIKDPNKRHFVVGDLRKFAEQMADKIKWDISNKNYILTHGVSSVDWSNYKHPLPEFVYQIYMESWENVHLVPKEAYELL